MQERDSIVGVFTSEFYEVFLKDHYFGILNSEVTEKSKAIGAKVAHFMEVIINLKQN